MVVAIVCPDEALSKILLSLGSFLIIILFGYAIGANILYFAAPAVEIVCGLAGL